MLFKQKEQTYAHKIFNSSVRVVECSSHSSVDLIARETHLHHVCYSSIELRTHCESRRIIEIGGWAHTGGRRSGGSLGTGRSYGSRSRRRRCGRLGNLCRSRWFFRWGGNFRLKNRVSHISFPDIIAHGDTNLGKHADDETFLLYFVELDGLVVRQNLTCAAVSTGLPLSNARTLTGIDELLQCRGPIAIFFLGLEDFLLDLGDLAQRALVSRRSPRRPAKKLTVLEGSASRVNFCCFRSCRKDRYQ
jgi:hypothetical protein